MRPKMSPALVLGAARSKRSHSKTPAESTNQTWLRSACVPASPSGSANPTSRALSGMRRPTQNAMPQSKTASSSKKTESSTLSKRAPRHSETT